MLSSIADWISGQPGYVTAADGGATSLLYPYGDLMQVVNSSLLVVLVSMAVFFGWYVVRRWRSWRDGDGDGVSLYDDVRPALALLVFVAGDGIIRVMVWFLRWSENAGVSNPLSVGGSMLLIILGMVVAIFGGLCVIRVFSPKAANGLPWVFTLIAMLAFVIFTWPR